jgi:hypothetical protein
VSGSTILYCRRVSDAIKKISCRLNPKKQEKWREGERERETRKPAEEERTLQHHSSTTN